jgi:hypothetical protein
MTPVEGETAVIFLGFNGLAGWALIWRGILRTAKNRATTPGEAVTAPAPEAAPTLRPTPVMAVARSTKNPGLAAIAARRARNEHGQFLPSSRRDVA